ncbi:RimJ/RimL family protein N-acetyltransferase [Streptohalobacillus salinus]|uniref:RimJ/RimL family protein N-acetyltransferase n=1 Tax=Streptohalobacillus salinus TaxID=621096 RepID=A0A2V3WDU5_9BACI|nr:GNAT family protein [Streptohalobacillus salinus]PXW92204.1 RimJ/RimL family protein N-acetyltransferase [Streptohalobacillus salinus]
MLIIERFTEADIDTLLAFLKEQSREQLFNWAGTTFTPPVTRQQVLAYLNEGKSKRLPVNHYIVKAEKTGEAVGHFQLAEIDAVNKSVFLNRVYIHEPEQGKGYGAALLAEVKRLVLRDWGYHRLALYVLSTNTRALSLYRQAGFVEEGCLRDARLFNGEYVSLVQLSLLDSD